MNVIRNYFYSLSLLLLVGFSQLSAHSNYTGEYLTQLVSLTTTADTTLGPAPIDQDFITKSSITNPKKEGYFFHHSIFENEEEIHKIKTFKRKISSENFLIPFEFPQVKSIVFSRYKSINPTGNPFYYPSTSRFILIEVFRL